MRQFADRVRQVAIVYATQLSSWVWALGLLLLAFVLLRMLDSEPGKLSLITYAWFIAMFVGNWIVDQLKHQFGHPRANLLPNFNLPHVAVPLGIIFIGIAVPPAIAAVAGRINPVPYAAVSSFAIAVFLLVRLLPGLGWPLVMIAFLAVHLLTDSGHDLGLIKSLFQPALSIPLLIVAWLGIGFYFFKYCHLAEDDAAYQRIRNETLTVAASGGEGETRATYRNAARWWVISDRWHAHIGGFHQFQTFRVIRLLRYGFNATPAELTALGAAVLMTVFVGWIVSDNEDPYDITRSTSAVFLIVPALFAAMAPIAVAGGAIGWRVPRLKNEILFPLTRRELIDDLLLASAWHSLFIWFLGCASGAAILIYTLPTESRTISLFATAALLTGAFAVATYGFSLHVVMYEVKVAQLFMMGLLVLAFIFLMTAWWSSRGEIGDAFYWVIAAFVLCAGVLVTHTGRCTWFNQEFG